MQCNTCGTLLPPAADSCPKCGTPTSTNSNYDAIPYIETQEYQEQARYPVQPETPVTIEHSPLPVDPGKYAKPKRPASIPSWMTTLIILLTLLLIGEGIGSIVYSVRYRPTDLHIQATKVAQNFLGVQATATAQARAITDALTPEQVYQQATSGTPMIDDPLKNSSGNVWYHYGTAGDDKCSFLGNAYHIKATKDTYGTCIGYNTNLADFAIQFQMKIITGDVGGIMFRLNGSGNVGKAYIFFIDTHSSYQFGIDTQQINILKSGTNPAIIPGFEHSNSITVIARNNHINLYVNGQPLTSVADSACTTGQIAFTAGVDTAKPFDVAFSNVKVWNL